MRCFFMRCTAEPQDAMDVKTFVGIREINGRKILPDRTDRSTTHGSGNPQLLTSKRKGSSCSAQAPWLHQSDQASQPDPIRDVFLPPRWAAFDSPHVPEHQLTWKINYLLVDSSEKSPSCYARGFCICVWHSNAQLMGTDTAMPSYHPLHVCCMACAAARQSSHPQEINTRPTALLMAAQPSAQGMHLMWDLLSDVVMQRGKGGKKAMPSRKCHQLVAGNGLGAAAPLQQSHV